jgi:uroporphyrinogen-III synthase
LRFPLINIVGPPDSNAAQSALATIGENDLIIFVSANAARFAGVLLPDVASRVGQSHIACVGEATAAALERVGILANLVPTNGTTSEALLAMDELDDAHVAGRRVAIVKGEGGRDLLARELDERGAKVTTVDVYRRQLPQGDLPAFLDHHANEIDMVVLTSGEALQRFVSLAGRERVGALPLVLPSDRVLEQAVEMGLGGPFSVPRRMSDAELAGAASRLAAALK